MDAIKEREDTGDPPCEAPVYHPPTVRYIGSVADLTRGSGTGPGGLSAPNTGMGRLKTMLNEKDRDGNRF